MKNKKILYLILVVVILVILLLVFLLKKDTNDVAVNTEDTISTETEVIDTETVEVESEVTEVEVSDKEVQHIKEEHKLIDFESRPWLETGEDPANTWYYGVTWTSSSGYELKINDGWAKVVVEGGSHTGALYEDGTEDKRPNSDYMNAVLEFIYSDPAYKNGLDRYNPEVVDVDKLPKVTTVSEKKTSFDTKGELRAYADEFTIYSTFQGTGEWESNPLFMLQVNEDFVGAAAMGQGYLWEIERMGDYWKLTIRKNLSELDWHGILTSLKSIHPSAQGIYDAVFSDCYDEELYFKEADSWYTIENAQVMFPSETPQGQIWYYFK